MDKILVPTDFSDYAEKALDFAVQVARKGNCTIQLLHIVEGGQDQTFNTMGIVEIDDLQKTYYSQLMRVSKTRIEKLASDEKYSGVKIETEVKVGRPYDSIAENIESYHPDMIVMGTLGSSGIEEIIIGSNTERVVRNAKCPVISIPHASDFNEIKNVVYATNLESDDRVLARLKTFLDFLGANIHLLWVNTVHVIENEEEMEQRLQAKAQEHGLSNCNVYVRKNVTVESGIFHFAEEIHAEMIGMATHGRQGLAHIFSGSLAEDIVNHSQRPVWTMTMGT